LDFRAQRTTDKRLAASYDPTDDIIDGRGASEGSTFVSMDIKGAKAVKQVRLVGLAPFRRDLKNSRERIGCHSLPQSVVKGDLHPARQTKEVGKTQHDKLEDTMKLIASHLDHARSVLAHLAIVCLALAFKNAPGAEILVESLSLEGRQKILNDINAFRSKDQKCDGQIINPGIEKPFGWSETVEQVAKEQSAYMAEHDTLGSIDGIEHRVNAAVRPDGYRAIYIRIILRQGNYKEAIKTLLDEPTKYQRSCEKIMFNHPNRAMIAIGRAIRIDSNSEKRFWTLIMFAPESVGMPPSALSEPEDNIIFEKGWLLGCSSANTLI
jgi:hypothetical protein